MSHKNDHCIISAHYITSHDCCWLLQMSWADELKLWFAHSVTKWLLEKLAHLKHHYAAKSNTFSLIKDGCFTPSKRRDIWSKWWGDMIWPKKRHAFKERSKRLVTFETLTRVMRTHDLTKDQRQRQWHQHDMACELVLHCWHFRQLWTGIHDNHFDLTIKEQN